MKNVSEEIIIKTLIFIKEIMVLFRGICLTNILLKRFYLMRVSL